MSWPETLTADQTMRLVYLLILLVAVGSYALVASRGRIATSLRNLVLWGLLFTGVAAAYELWTGSRGAMVAVEANGDSAVVLRRAFDGQFHLDLQIIGANGRAQPVRFIVDTGATDLVLTQEDAARLGYGAGSLQIAKALGAHVTGVASTANGVTRTARVSLPQVMLEGHMARDVPALVNEGALHASLLGMGFLERFQRIEITRDRLTIHF